MDKQKIKSVPRLTTDNPVDNFQTALNFTDVSEDGWVWLRQPEMALTEYARQLVKGHGSSIDLGCNDMELSESLTDHLFDDPKQSIDGLIAEHYTILWAYATLREKLKWYEDAGIPVIPNYGLSTIRRAINRYGTAPQLQMAIKEMSELTKAICNLQRAVTFNYRKGKVNGRKTVNDQRRQVFNADSANAATRNANAKNDPDAARTRMIQRHAGEKED